MTQIPKCIHQTWKTNILPEQFQILSKTWKEKHSDWEYRLWSDHNNRDFVKKYYSSFLEIYDGYETNIQKADAIRYLILFKLGGVYVDLDFECFKNVSPLLNNKTCVFAKEPEDHCIMQGKDFILCNAFMASIPEHPFIGKIIDELYKNENRELFVKNKVMETTGPLMVSRVFSENSNLDIEILNADSVYPLSRKEVLKTLYTDKVPVELKNKLNQSYGVHYWFNTWIQNSDNFTLKYDQLRKV